MRIKQFKKSLLEALRFRGSRVRIKKGLKMLFSERALFATNSLTSGGCMFMGDLIQQELNKYFDLTKPKEDTRYDWTRLQRMFAVGTFLGCLHHFYYIYLDVLLPKVTLRNVFLKIAADQIFCAPFTIILFLYCMSYLEGKTLEKATEEVQSKIIMIYLGDVIYWPPVQFINFYYVSTKYRVFYINVATMIYNVFLSFMKFDYHQ